MTNPFTPEPGAMPPVLADRDDLDDQIGLVGAWLWGMARVGTGVAVNDFR